MLLPVEPPAMPVDSSSGGSGSFGFEMELSGSRQQQYQDHFSELKDSEIVTDMPGELCNEFRNISTSKFLHIFDSLYFLTAL